MRTIESLISRAALLPATARIWFAGVRPEGRAAAERVLLFSAGVVILTAGLAGHLDAQGLTTHYNDERFSNAVNAIMTYLEGTFGALVMACAGIGAILSAAFGQYRAALSLLVVSVGAFIVRSVMATFFNDQRVEG